MERALGRSLEVACPPFIDGPVAVVVILVADLERGVGWDHDGEGEE
jgi:hypothetical protein